MTRYNPNDERSLKRLRDAKRWSRECQKDFLDQYIILLKQYVGKHYGRGGTADKKPVNMTRMAVDVWQRKLVTRAPSVLALTSNPTIKQGAYELELAMKHLLEEIHFGEYLQEVTKMALMGFGAMKVGIAPTMDTSNPNYRLDAGQPYAEPILWEDWVHDMNARRRDEWDFVGNRYRVDYEDMMENPMFDPQVKDSIQPDQDETDIGEFGEERQTRSTISRREDGWQREEYRQHVELWDMWLPHDNLLVTLPAQDGLRPLLVREWDGPESGAYKMLAYCKVPGNVMPSSPASHMYDMDDLLNRMFNKIGRQGERQKTIGLADTVSASDGTAETIMKAKDGDVVAVGRPEAVKELKFGGADPNNMSFVIWLRQLASYVGGNIDLVGGLSAQSSTARQDQILAESSSELIADMQGETERFTTEIVQDLAFYLYHDPLITLPLVKRVPGTDLEVPFNYGPERREADFFEYNIRIQPHTLRSKSPEQRLSTVMQVVGQIVMPMMPLLAQQGKILNIDALFRLISHYGDLPEFDDMIINTGFPMPMGNDQGGGKPGQTERRYVRENVSTGGSGPGRDHVMMQSLINGQGQANQQQMQSAMMI